MSVWVQRPLRLHARARGFHLVTGEVLDAVPEIGQVTVGVLHVFVRHTSASLSLNENASGDVRRDMESWANHMAPEDARYWTHVLEGSDDMPAHVKASVFGSSVSIPITRGRLALGTWQG
ncbi:MAG: secondary thiamine-phosphate synthase enzyme YjbQ, partial [Thermoleophilia bacterium]|nr:secondary thiamine-phosphate synthase enzyme YjbQ [Thermoleophilia bacterium]